MVQMPPSMSNNKKKPLYYIQHFQMQEQGFVRKSRHTAFCFMKEQCAYGRTWKDFSIISHLIEHINSSKFQYLNMEYNRIP